MAETATIRSLRSYQIAGLVFLALLLLGVGGWAAAASISGAVIAQARVVVETHAKKVQHVEGGIVSEILIKEGSRVEAGQLLLRLDVTETNANLAIINAQLDELMARQARLEAERDDVQAIVFPDEITSRLDEPRVRTAYLGQRNIFQARHEAKQGEQAQLRYKVEQLGEEIRGLSAQQTAKDRQFQLITQELDSLKDLKDKGLVRLNRMLSLEREQARLEGERGELMAQTAQKRGEIGETRLRIIQIDKNRNAEVVSELRETQTKVAELLERRLAAQIRLERTEIRSPRSGFVHQLAVHTVGGVVSSAEPAMLIVPEQDTLIFEAQVAPSDIDQVQIGQKAMIRLHAFDPGMTPELAGGVKLISADVIIEPETKTSYYMVRIQVSPEELAKLGGRALVPGMVAEAFIQTQERTVLQYLLKPITDRIAHAFRER